MVTNLQRNPSQTKKRLKNYIEMEGMYMKLKKIMVIAMATLTICTSTYKMASAAETNYSFVFDSSGEKETDTDAVKKQTQNNYFKVTTDSASEKLNASKKIKFRTLDSIDSISFASDFTDWISGLGVTLTKKYYNGHAQSKYYYLRGKYYTTTNVSNLIQGTWTP